MKELYAIDKSTLDAIGNAIRVKKGTTAPIPVTSLASEIESIEGGSVGELLQAGTYKMVEFRYEDSYPGCFAWGSQTLVGKVLDGSASKEFTDITNDGAYSLEFRNNGSIVVDIYPYWNPYDYDTRVVLEEAQFVSADFKAYFDACFTKVEDEGDDDVVEELKDYTIKAKNYLFNNDVTGNYSYLPYPEYTVSADIKGTWNGIPITRIVISGYGLGMDDSNGLMGEPYPVINFFNGNTLVDSRVSYDLYGSNTNLYVEEDAQVTATFCLAFKGMFA